MKEMSVPVNSSGKMQLRPVLYVDFNSDEFNSLLNPLTGRALSISFRTTDLIWTN